MSLEAGWAVRRVLATAGAVVCCLLTAAPSAAGSLQGTVRVSGGPVAPKKLPVTIDQYLCGKETDAGDLVVSRDRGLRNAVVSLRSPPPGARWEPSAPAIQMDQKHCVFVPRVVVVPVGGTVEFLNSDRLLHNLHSYGAENPRFNRTQPKGRTVSIQFTRPEIVRVECDLHSWMRGWVVVAEHPVYAITDERGEFTLGTVPPGQHTLDVWHETLGSLAKPVTVGETGVVTVTVEMPLK